MVEQLVFLVLAVKWVKRWTLYATVFSFGAAPGFLAYSFVMHEFSYFGWIAVIFTLCVACGD